MQPPLSPADIRADGLFLAAAHDLAWKQHFGNLQRVEFNFHDYSEKPNGSPESPVLDAAVDVRVTTASGIHDLAGTRLALVAGGNWEWLTAAVGALDIPAELPLSEGLAVARTLMGGAPVFLAPPTRAGAAQAVVAVQLPFPQLPVNDIVAEGLHRPWDDVDEVRAIEALSAMMGASIPYQVDDAASTASIRPAKLTSWAVPTSGGAAPTNGRAASATGAEAERFDLSRLRTEAFYLAHEVELYWQGRFAVDPEFSVDLHSALATAQTKQGPFTSPAHVLATRTGGMWTWGWADPFLQGLPVQARSQRLRTFGAQHQIAQFLRPQLPVSEAVDLDLPRAAMPVLGLWHAVEVALSPETTAVLLLEQPQLPPLQPEVAAAVLAAPAPRGIGKQEAEAAYYRFRQAGGRG